MSFISYFQSDKANSNVIYVLQSKSSDNCHLEVTDAKVSKRGDLKSSIVGYERLLTIAISIRQSQMIDL